MNRSTSIVIIVIWCTLLTPLGLSAAGAAIEEGIRQFGIGDLEAARETLDAIGPSDGDHAKALAYLGRIDLAENALDAAIDRLRAAVDLEPGDSQYRTWLGRAYITKLQTVSFFEKGILSGRALEALMKAVDLDPENAEARVSLAGYYLNAPALAGGSKKKARQQAEALMELDPARGSYVMAGIHIHAEEHHLALQALDRCLATQPQDLDCGYREAMLLQELERYEQAFAAFEYILELEPQTRGALYQIGRTAALSGTHLDRGSECLEAYLRLEVEPGYPGYDGAHWRLGMIYEHRGDMPRARAEYEAAIEINPEDDSYRESLRELGAA